MQVVAITGKQQCRLVDQPEPTIAGNYAKVKVLTAPMCTEVHAYRDGHVTEELGHEAAGVVLEVPATSHLKVGQRVVVMPQNGCGLCVQCLCGEHIHCTQPINPHAVCGCANGRATYAQVLIQQDWLLVPIPEDIDMDHASMACCGLGPTFNSMQLMDVNAMDTLLVSGLGPVGLGAVVNGLVRGARVLAIEGNPWRAALAKSMGVEEVVDPSNENALAQIMELTKGLGVDKSVETSSAEMAPDFLVKASRKKGHVTSVGWGGPILARDIVAKGLHIHGAWHWNHLCDVGAMWTTIRKTEKLLDMQITHRMPMNRVEEAFKLQLGGECGKILLHPWES